MEPTAGGFLQYQYVLTQVRLFTVYFHTVIYMFLFFFVIDHTQKQTMLIKWFNFLFIKDLPSVSQSNEQAVTTDNGEQYILSNITYTNFQNCYFFSFRSILKEVLLKCK